MKPIRLTYGLATQIGNLRKVNCDTLVAQTWSDDVGLFVVADGIGPEGKKASQLACEIIVGEMNSYFQNPSNLPINDSNRQFSLLKAAIRKANLEVFIQIPQSGTTLSAALIISESLYIAHVGDSRIYLISNNETQQLTVDHTLSYKWLRHGHITIEQLKTHPVDDALYRALGQADSIEIDTQLTNILPNTWLLLCTNGLVKWNWGIISEEEVYTTLLKNDPQLAANILVGLAKARESYDDISAVVTKFNAA